MASRGRLLGVVGFAGCGKSTVQKHLVAQGWHPFNFGSALKDVVAKLFDWPRELLEGDTIESREWRETVDPFWNDKLSKTIRENFGGGDLTPRRAMQILGTDLVRNMLGQQFWCWRLQSAIEKELAQGRDVIVGDVRFDEEIRLIRDMGGKVWRVKRGQDPSPDEISKLHRSETDWMSSELDLTIENDGSVEDLYKIVDLELMKQDDIF
jgi:hypothetical protein